MSIDIPTWQPPCTNGTPIVKPSALDRKVKRAKAKQQLDATVAEAVKPKPKGFTKQDRYKIVSVGVCEYCGIRKGEKRADGTIARMEADHRVSQKDGGLSTLENGACSCEQCNNGKRARSVRGRVIASDPPPPKPDPNAPELVAWREQKNAEIPPVIAGVKKTSPAKGGGAANRFAPGASPAPSPVIDNVREGGAA